MPRNPNKRKCQSPGCNAWAMRSLAAGMPANHCRAHLDHVLGPRRVGAPKRNINALKHGRYAVPASKKNLTILAHAIAQEPEKIVKILTNEMYYIHSRTSDAYFTLLLIARISEQLCPLVADHRFHQELDEFISGLPPDKRPKIESMIWKHVLPLSPMKRLSLLRDIVRDANENKQ